MTSFDTARKTIGDIGEDLVQEFFNSTKSTDPFDPIKDGIMSNNMKYAVKTFRLNKKYKGFWVSDNETKTMWKNLDNVDLIFFVRIPEKVSDLAEIYLAINHKNGYTRVTTKEGVPCRNYLLTNCLKLYNVDKDRSRMLYEHSNPLRSVA